jgi:hypothetical protein
VEASADYIQTFFVFLGAAQTPIAAFLMHNSEAFQASEACKISQGITQLLGCCMVVLQAIFNHAQGPECIFLWRAIGAALVSIVPTASYSLKVLHIPLLTNAAFDLHDVEISVLSR